jgi:hypothetical protein
VNEDAGSAYIRIGGNIKQFQLAGVTASAEPLSTTLTVGNTTGANDIIVDIDRQIKTTDTGYIKFGDTGADLNAITINNGGDGITTPANSFGFSGVDPYWTAQTVDIGGIIDTLSLDPQGLGNKTGIVSSDPSSSNLTQTQHTPDTIYMYGYNTSLSKTDSVSIDPSGTLYGTMMKSDYYTTYMKSDYITTDPQGISNETGIYSKDTSTTDNVFMSVNSSTMIGRLISDQVSTGAFHSVIVDSLMTKIAGTDGASVNNSIMLDSFGKRIQIDTTSYNNIGNGKVTNTISGVVANSISFETTQTTNNTISTIHTFTCVTSGAKSYKVRVVGTKDDNTKAYLSEMFGLYLYDGATVTLVGTLDKVEKTNFSTATSTISISGTQIRVRVTGETATTINWQVYVEMNSED